MAGRKTFRILTSSQQSGIQSKNSITHIVQQIHIGWQYTQDNYNNTHKTTDNNTHKTLKIQHVQKANNTKERKYLIYFLVLFSQTY